MSGPLETSQSLKYGRLHLRQLSGGESARDPEEVSRQLQHLTWRRQMVVIPWLERAFRLKDEL